MKTLKIKKDYLVLSIPALMIFIFSCQSKKIAVQPETDLYYTSALSALTEPVTQTAVGSFKVITPVSTNIKDTITADGSIDFDQRDINTISSRVTGRVEKLYVKYNGQPIKKGQPLMEIYSPQLLSVQKDLLQTRKENDRSLIKALEKKLINLGMQPDEIQTVIRSEKPLSVITISSPYQGISRKTNGQTANNMTSDILNIREGSYVEAGETIFTIQGISRHWALLHVFANDMACIHTGDPVLLFDETDPSHLMRGKVDFIPIYHDKNGKTTTIRVYLENMPASWKTGTLIQGSITVKKTATGFRVPLSAVNRLGTKSVAWVRDKNHKDEFHVRQIQTGMRTEDSIEILSGIEADDQIVENTAYMVGSDSFIQ